MLLELRREGAHVADRAEVGRLATMSPLETCSFADSQAADKNGIPTRKKWPRGLFKHEKLLRLNSHTINLDYRIFGSRAVLAENFHVNGVRSRDRKLLLVNTYTPNLVG